MGFGDGKTQVYQNDWKKWEAGGRILVTAEVNPVTIRVNTFQVTGREYIL